MDKKGFMFLKAVVCGAIGIWLLLMGIFFDVFRSVL
jgi:hypothetical protein